MAVRRGAGSATSSAALAAGGQRAWRIGLFAFALSHPDEHAFRIDITHVQGHDIGDAQAGSVGGHQGGTITNGGDMLEELGYFGRAEDYRQLVRHPASREGVFGPRRLQGYVIEEFSGCHEVVDRFGGILALVDHIQLVFAKPTLVQRGELIRLTDFIQQPHLTNCSYLKLTVV